MNKQAEAQHWLRAIRKDTGKVSDGPAAASTGRKMFSERVKRQKMKSWILKIGVHSTGKMP